MITQIKNDMAAIDTRRTNDKNRCCLLVRMFERGNFRGLGTVWVAAINICELYRYGKRCFNN